MTSESETTKTRMICFCQYHPDPHQARSAVPYLRQVDGVAEVEQVAERCLELRYDVARVTLQVLEDAMIEAGFHLDNTLTAKLLRALHYFTEENERQALGCGVGETNCVRKVFVNRYARLQHGCRDDRPEHWRRYL